MKSLLRCDTNRITVDCLKVASIEAQTGRNRNKNVVYCKGCSAQNLFNKTDVIPTPYHYVDFTLSQATKSLRKSRVITLLYFRPLH